MRAAFTASCLHEGALQLIVLSISVQVPEFVHLFRSFQRETSHLFAATLSILADSATFASSQSHGSRTHVPKFNFQQSCIISPSSKLPKHRIRIARYGRGKFSDSSLEASHEVNEMACYSSAQHARTRKTPTTSQESVPRLIYHMRRA